MDEHVFNIAAQDPNIGRAAAVVRSQRPDVDVSMDQIQPLLQLLDMALANPADYPAIRAEIVRRGMADPEDLPEQFDLTILMSLMATLIRLAGDNGGAEHGGAEQQYAQGGLAQMARRLRGAGRNGDTMLAHINPREAALLKARGGSGTINPATGLPEFFGIKDLVKAAVPIATAVAAPYLAPMLGGSMLAAGAVAGGLGSALTGGNALQGALMGGLGQGLGGMVGGSLAPGLSATGQNVLGGSLLGGLGAAVTGGNPLRGAVMGGLGTYAGQAMQGVGGAGMDAAGRQFGNMLTAGYRPGEAALGAGISGLASSLTAGIRPSDAAVSNLEGGTVTGGSGQPISADAGDAMAKSLAAAGYGGAPAGTFKLPELSLQNALLGASALGALGGAPVPVQQAVSSLSKEQQEYFNRPGVQWDWARMQQDAAKSGMSLGQYMARNWDTVTGGTYNSSAPRFARGGALSQVAYLARGAGSGRADTIDARLSDGEYVIDAETVALLGDGSTGEGAKRLDEMRKRIRMQKGQALSKGRFSPNAKSPLAYLKGA